MSAVTSEDGGSVAAMIPRPKTFASKLQLLFVLVVATAQLGTWLIVSRMHSQQAVELITDELQRAAAAFARIVKERNDLLSAAAATAARDYAFKQLFGGEEIDVQTIKSVLPNFTLSGIANAASVLSLDGKLITSTLPAGADGDVYRTLAARADNDANSTAAGYGYVGANLYSLVVAPVRAPDIVAWLVIGFRIDREFAKVLKDQTGVEVTFANHRGQILATTLPTATATSLTSALPRLRESKMAMEVRLADEAALVATRELVAGAELSAALVLQYSLDEKLKPARFAENLLLGVALGSVVLAMFVSRAFARRLAQPIVELVGHTRRIAAGDYTLRIGRYRSDELGRLAEAFDQMSTGLAERDRVRDLLDKNVSPEVAAQLLRDGAALGGEEREATILFADLRGFSRMSEMFAPRDLLTVLNRFLDRMSEEIEQRGGVIDKFMGDGIMALFGAPIAQGDAADRAVATAMAMERALADLNRQLEAEGHKPLALGIGINTARIVAGNIGSQRRRNYSVIGDGVNVASRLQGLTRTPEYGTNIIASAATISALRAEPRPPLRSLGPVQVKGRTEPVVIFAIDSAVELRVAHPEAKR
jgi:adenylate cyclase